MIIIIPKDIYIITRNLIESLLPRNGMKRQDIEQIELHNEVIELCDEALGGCYKLKQVKLPAGMKLIGNRAFRYCESLEVIHIPMTVEYIGDFALYGCKMLKQVTFEEVSSNGQSLISTCNARSDLQIGRHVFANSHQIKTLFFPKRVSEIGAYACNNCKGLTTVVIERGVKKIGIAAFKNCQLLTSVTIGDGVAWIGETAFADCKYLQYIIIPTSIKHIGKHVFIGCKSEKKCMLPPLFRYKDRQYWESIGIDTARSMTYTDQYALTQSLQLENNHHQSIVPVMKSPRLSESIHLDVATLSQYYLVAVKQSGISTSEMLMPWCCKQKKRRHGSVLTN